MHAHGMKLISEPQYSHSIVTAETTSFSATWASGGVRSAVLLNAVEDGIYNLNSKSVH